MVSNYVIVLFKNKKKYKIIKEYNTYKNALSLYNQKVKECDNVIFDVQTENGLDVKYEIALLEKSSSKVVAIFKTDEMGRNIKLDVDNPDYSILKIQEYKIPEKIQNVKTKEREDVNSIIKKYINDSSLKLVSKLNNKIIIQDDDKFNLFSSKSEYDAERFLINLESHMISNNRKNCLIVRDSSIEQKKYLYEVLSNVGFDKKMLYRKTTTHLKDK